MITYLWRYDEYVWLHPRQMLQIHFYLVLVGYWGVRPGEIVESSSHRGKNEGLLYKDITLSLAYNPDDDDDILKYQLKIWLRFRKNHRGKKGEW
jgi:hypothetical protein